MLKLIVCLLGCVGLALSHQDPSKIHAVLVSAITCDGACQVSYAVEVEIARAYHLLINQGVPAQNIIVFHRDDVTTSIDRNPYPGYLYNDRNMAVDYRKGLIIDYTEDDVTVDNVLAVLQGEKDKIKGGNGRVLESTEEDRVFLFHGGHGREGILAFPNHTVMTAKQFNDALKNIQKKKMYNELVFYLLACHSGSMFEGQLTDDQNIWVSTAASPDDNAKGRDCTGITVNDQYYFICFNTEYGYGWLTDSEMNNPDNETLETQFEQVKHFVKKNRVNQYGKMEITNEVLSNFQGSKNESNINSRHSFDIENEIDYKSSIPISPLAEYIIIKRNLAKSKSFDEQIILKAKLETMEQEQKDVKQIARDIVSSVLPQKFTQFNRILTKSPQRISQLDCHHEVMQQISVKCKKIMKSPFVGNFITSMANLCEEGVQSSTIIAQINNKCI